MSGAAYAIGWLVLLGALAPWVWAAVELRRWLLPTWYGAWARLAESVAAAAAVTISAEILGSAGALRAVPLVAVGLAGGAVALALHRVPRRAAPALDRPLPVDRWALVGAGLVVTAVFAQWLAFTAQAFRLGITAYDALFYHGPIAVRFAQTGYVSQLQPIVPGEAVSFYPATTELWHAIGLVAFRSDLVSPVLNLATLGIALLAAWCVGRALGGAPAALAGIGLVAAAPYMVQSQPGSNFNDFAALAAILGGAALLSQAGRWPAAHVFAALAAGLAAGIKLSFLAPAVLLAAAAVVLAPRGRRLVTGGTWVGVMLLAGGYWYARNFARIGNPLPGVALPGFPAPALPVDQRYGATLLGHRLPLAAYHAGLRDYFGPAWPVMVGAVVLAIVFGLATRRSAWHRAMAAVVVVSLFVYAATPVSGDANFFRFNLRYTLGLQGLAVVVLATAPWCLGRRRQRLLVLIAGAGVALAWVEPAKHHRDPFELPAWPPGDVHRVAAAATAVAVAGLAVAAWAAWRTGRSAVAGAAVAVTLAVVAVAAAGRGIDNRYQAARYRHLPGDLAAAWAWSLQLHHARIGVVGIYQQYPFVGSDASNHVQYVGIATPHGGFADAPTCRTWKQAVDAGRYGYVVTGRDGIYPPPGEPRQYAWTKDDPAAVPVFHAGLTTVFKLSAALDPAQC